MTYEVRKWENGYGYGIWRKVWFFYNRVRNIGPFGLDRPWITEEYAKDKAKMLEKDSQR